MVMQVYSSGLIERQHQALRTFATKQHLEVRRRLFPWTIIPYVMCLPLEAYAQPRKKLDKSADNNKHSNDSRNWRNLRTLRTDLPRGGIGDPKPLLQYWHSQVSRVASVLFVSFPTTQFGWVCFCVLQRVKSGDKISYH